jgi:hypothetical protein
MTSMRSTTNPLPLIERAGAAIRGDVLDEHAGRPVRQRCDHGIEQADAEPRPRRPGATYSR